jgi:hypothetical protein
MRTLGATTLTCEALVVFFAVLVAMKLSSVSGGLVWTVGGAFALAFLLLAGLLRFRWAFWVGSALQLALIAAGVVVPLMYFLGPVFAVIWATALWTGAKVDAARAQRARARTGHADGR